MKLEPVLHYCTVLKFTVQYWNLFVLVTLTIFWIESEDVGSLLQYDIHLMDA